MKIVGGAPSPFTRKARAVAIEVGLGDSTELIGMSPADPERCYEAEGCGLMLLHSFTVNLKERYDDEYIHNHFPRTIHLRGA